MERSTLAGYSGERERRRNRKIMRRQCLDGARAVMRILLSRVAVSHLSFTR
jgi:hypothetical protein